MLSAANYKQKLWKAFFIFPFSYNPIFVGNAYVFVLLANKSGPPWYCTIVHWLRMGIRDITGIYLSNITHTEWPILQRDKLCYVSKSFSLTLSVQTARITSDIIKRTPNL